MCPLKVSLPIIVILLVICRFSHCSSTMGSRNYNNEKKKKIRTNDRKLSGNEEIKEIVVGEGDIVSLPSADMYKNSASYGFMFDFRTIKRVTVIEFQFYTRNPDKVKYVLYTVQGGYGLSKHDINLWSLIASGTANSHGVEKPTVIDKMTSISIAADSVQAFYITLQTENLVYLSTDKKLNENFIWNDAVAVTTGSGVSDYPLGTNFFEPRSWCGSIHYYIMDFESLSPSMSPSLMPSITVVIPTLIPTKEIPKFVQLMSANQTFTVFGSDLSFMDRSTEKAFCNEIKVSLQQHFTETYGQNLEIQEFHAVNQFLLGKIYNEVVIFVEVGIKSSIDINLSNVLKSSITDLRQTILANLQRDNNEYFENVKRIVSVPTPELEKDYEIANVNQSILLVFSEGYSGLSLMDSSTEIKFEDEICNFFDQDITNFDMKSFIVMAYVTSQAYSHKNARLETWVTIQAKFLPSTVNFDVLAAIRSIINEDNQRLYYQLKKTNLPIFGGLKSVDSLASTMAEDGLSTLPSAATEINDEISSIKAFFTSTTGYIVCGAAALGIIVIGVVCCCCCKCGKSGEENNDYKDMLLNVLTKSTPTVSQSYGRDSFTNRSPNGPGYGGRRYSM